MEENLKKYSVRVRDELSGQVTWQKVSKEELCTGIEGKDMNLEDIGLALLNELREQSGMATVEPIEAAYQLKSHKILH